MSITMFTMTHKRFDAPKDKMYLPLHVGRELAEDLGYLGDNTGEHISTMNCYYSELTGVYWIWKNHHESEYVGVCHYRRYLINEQGSIFNETELLKLLSEYDIITSKKLNYDYTYYEGYEEAHNINDLIETGRVILEKYPEYYGDFERLVHSKQSYFGNIMVTSKKLFDEYAAWLFDIFLEVQERITIEAYDDYHKRVFGFISEFLLYVWVTHKNLKVYEGMVGMSEEKHETKEMRQKLATYFEARDIQGAKAYFMECYQKRPDVLLEASDITGELKLSMQVITTCENEQRNNLTSIVEQINDYNQLMAYFRTLNEAVKRYIKCENTEEDAEFLISHKVTYIALQIAVMLFCENEEASASVLKRMAEDMDRKN